MEEEAYGKQRRKIFTIIFLDAVLLAAVIVYFGIIRPQSPIKINGIFIESPKEIDEFQFIDNRERLFSKATLKGRWTLMVFGFTHCAIICPTMLDVLDKTYKLLQKDLPNHQLPQVVFISVDPARDTIDKINQFVTSFNPYFIGAKADIKKTVALEKQLHLARAQEKFIDKNNYIINHSMDIVLFNPAARVQVYFSYPYKPEQIARDYKIVLNSLKKSFGNSI